MPGLVDVHLLWALHLMLKALLCQISVSGSGPVQWRGPDA